MSVSQIEANGDWWLEGLRGRAMYRGYQIHKRYAEAFEIVKEINAQGTPVLLVEQNALMALDVAHRAYVMETGQITLEGPAAELKTNEAVQKAYLGLD